MRAAIEGRVPARLLTDPHAVHDFSGDGAAHRTVGTNDFANYCAHAERSSATGFGFADGSKWNRAEHSEAAGADPRTAQKRSPVESSALGGEPRKGAAARRIICLPDQHDCLPHLGYLLTR